jgi:hypothetical protein
MVGFGSLLKDLRERRRGSAPTVEKEIRTLGSGSGLFIP